MKILKIELQNINSLKSDEPIVIDFESKLFEDVGLYAITGPTGAGKTTILDAITIAMYHSVPRFNKSNIKAGLEDVVSKGAHFAMSRVEFRSNSTRYEASWSMRLKSKTGKVLANPPEEIRLKDLSSEKILAEKKREFQQKIEEITQLDYHQFLRSAMLAQGEFAAFLSANAKEKSALLEQITGEEIYKKIGEEIGSKIGSEKRKLELIQAKINNDDLLSNEYIAELKKEQGQIENEIKLQEKELKCFEKIIKWYADKKQIIKEQQKLNEGQLQLDAEKEENKGVLEKLRHHELAEPFQTIITELRRIETEIKDKTGKQDKLKQDIVSIKENIVKTEKQETQLKENYNKQEAEQKAWQPRLEKVAELITRISSLMKEGDKLKANSEKRKLAINKFKIQIEDNTKAKEKAESELKKLEGFLAENKKILTVKNRLTDWSSALTQLKSLSQTIGQTKEKIKNAQTKEVEIKSNLTEAESRFKKGNTSLSDSRKKLEELEKEIKKLNMAALLAKQKELSNQKTYTKELLDLSQKSSDLSKKVEKLNEDYSQAKELKGKQAKDIVQLEQGVKNAELALKDVEKILELEQRIKSFGEERQKLVKNEPCPLCGSKEHPYVVGYDKISLSVTALEVDKRKQVLKDVRELKQQAEIKKAGLLQKLEGLEKSINEAKTEIESINANFNEHESSFKITENKEIKQNLDSLLNLEAELDKQVKYVQQLQQKKDELNKIYSDRQEDVNTLKNRITSINGELTALKNALLEWNSDLKTYTENFKKKTLELEPQLLEFGFVLPAINEIEIFIERLKTAIEEYEKKVVRHTSIKSSISEIQIKITNDKTQLNEKIKEEEKAQEEHKKLVDELDIFKTKRIDILPADISIKTKREILQKALDNARGEYEKVNGTLNKLKTKNVAAEKEISILTKDLAGLQTILGENNSALIAKIENSPFDSREEIEQHLLTPEDKLKYEILRKNLDKRTIELKTLNKKLSTELADLHKAKDFELTMEDAGDKANEIKKKKENLTVRMGEINEKFKLDQQIRNRNKDVMKEITAQEQVLAKWNKLFALLGGNKYAFNTYVQRLTLQRLIRIANLHLTKLNPRYSLIMKEEYKKGEELNFNLVDHFQTDEMRVVDTSSGGEKFLISLALALGLSDLASKNVNIESLFIDEGFGTLDANMLETVISTLETLQAQGKMIGVISHVESMKERIPSQIQVTKKHNGVSEVKVV